MVDNARKWLIDLGVFVVVLGAWGCSVWAGSTGTKIDPVTKTWTFPGPSMETLTSVLAWMGPLVALFVVVGAIAKKRWLLLVLAVSVSGFAALVTLSLGFFGSTSGPGRGEVTAADGNTYMLLASGFQDHLYWLGRVDHADEWSKVVVPLARSDDFGAPNVRLVRPAGSAKVISGVRTSADGRFVVLEVWEACASIALDTKTGALWSSEQFEQGSTIGDLSPFVLLDADDELHPADVAALRGESKCPRSQTLDELDHSLFESHPNPRVRALFEK